MYGVPTQLCVSTKIIYNIEVNVAKCMLCDVLPIGDACRFVLNLYHGTAIAKTYYSVDGKIRTICEPSKSEAGKMSHKKYQTFSFTNISIYSVSEAPNPFKLTAIVVSLFAVHFILLPCAKK